MVGGCAQRGILALEGCEYLGEYSSEAGLTISWCAPDLVSLESATETLRPGRVGKIWLGLIQCGCEQLLVCGWAQYLVNTKV